MHHWSHLCRLLHRLSRAQQIDVQSMIDHWNPPCRWAESESWPWDEVMTLRMLVLCMLTAHYFASKGISKSILSNITLRLLFTPSELLGEETPKEFNERANTQHSIVSPRKDGASSTVIASTGQAAQSQHRLVKQHSHSID